MPRYDYQPLYHLPVFANPNGMLAGKRARPGQEQGSERISDIHDWPWESARLFVPDAMFPTDVGMTLVRAIEEGELSFRSARVLDIGCGAGLHTITAPIAGASKVTAIDVHPPAVAATAWNVLANELPLDRVELEATALCDFEAHARFDIVMCNPPHFPSDASYDGGRGVDIAALGGATGRALYDQLLPAADRWLTDGGTLLISHSSLTDIPATRRQFTEAGYRVVTLLRHSMDLNLLAYAKKWDSLWSNMLQLRAKGRAHFTDKRFFVDALAISRPIWGDTW